MIEPFTGKSLKTPSSINTTCPRVISTLNHLVFYNFNCFKYYYIYKSSRPFNSTKGFVRDKKRHYFFQKTVTSHVTNKVTNNACETWHRYKHKNHNALTDLSLILPCT